MIYVMTMVSVVLILIVVMSVFGEYDDDSSDSKVVHKNAVSCT